MLDFNVPTGWRKVIVDDIKASPKGSIVSGPFGSNIGKRFFVDKGIPVIRGNNLTLGGKKFVDNGFVFITPEKANELKNCIAIGGDIVFTAAGTLGQVGLIPENSHYPVYIISNKQLRLRCNSEIAYPEFLYYWFSQPKMREYIANQNTGASIPLITLGTLRNLPLLLPPLPTQRRIAEILSAYDDLIENNIRRIRILEGMAQSIYREWFGQANAESLPEGWEVGRLDDALILQRGFDLPTQDRQDGHVPVFAATGIIGTHNEAKVKAPGIVTGRSGSLGTVIYVDKDFWPLNTTLWVKEFRRVTPLYAYYLLQDLKLEQFNSGAAVPTLNRNDIHGLPVIIPAKNILDQFDEIVSPMYSQINILQKKNANLRRTRDMLLPRLVGGEVAV